MIIRRNGRLAVKPILGGSAADNAYKNPLILGSYPNFGKPARILRKKQVSSRKP
jgi:hypothetical protein